MTSSTITENDVLKTLVRKGAVADLFKEIAAQFASKAIYPKPAGSK